MKNILLCLVAVLLVSAVGFAQGMKVHYPSLYPDTPIDFDGSINSYAGEWTASEEIEIDLDDIDFSFEGTFYAQKQDVGDGTFDLYLGAYIYDNTQDPVNDWVAFYMDPDHDETGFIEEGDVMCVVYRSGDLKEYHVDGGWSLQPDITHCGEVVVMEILGLKWAFELKINVDDDPFSTETIGLLIQFTAGGDGQEIWPDGASIGAPDEWGDLTMKWLAELEAEKAPDSPEDHVWEPGDPLNSMLEVDVTARINDLVLREITVKATWGTGDEENDIVRAYLVSDLNDNNEYDAGDMLLDTGSYDVDGGMIIFEPNYFMFEDDTKNLLFLYQMQNHASGTYKFRAVQLKWDDSITLDEFTLNYGDATLESAVKTGAGVCMGDVILTLVPSTVHVEDETSAEISGLEFCKGMDVKVKRNDCDGPIAGTCVVGDDGEGCVATFNAPGLEGLYTYVACVSGDKPTDFDSTEGSLKDLSVVPAEELTCNDYDDYADCISENCNWCAGGCQEAPCACSEYSTENSCTINNCNWCDDACQSTDCDVPPPSQDCTGTLQASLSGATFNPGDSIGINIIGLSDCAGTTVALYDGECTGNVLTTTILTADTGSLTLNAPAVGDYSYYVCSDLDSNGAFGAGESAAISFTVEEGTTPSAEQDNTILFVAVAIIAIIAVVIVVLTGILKK